MINNQLRILLVLPLYGGSLPVGRFCVRGLAEQGHLVEVFEAPGFHSAYQALDDLRVTGDRLDHLRQGFLNVVSQAILAKVETFEPDLVLAMAQAPLSIQALKRLRKDGVRTAMWFVEDYKLFPYWQSFAPHYDVFAVIQKEPFPTRLAEVGQENVLYLPLAAQPDFHAPRELTPNEKHKYGSDLSFMGAGYPNRRKAFRHLIDFDFKIWGTEWDGDHVLAPYVQQGGRRVTSEECVTIFNAGKINLNLHSSIDPDRLVTGGDFVNPRTFEVACCGAFQLVDQRGLMPELFGPEELATFAGLEELKEKIAYYLSRPEERQALCDNARTRVLAEHTYGHRMRSLLDFTAQCFPDWPGQRDVGPGLPRDLPGDLARDLDQLLGRLGLSREVAFRDLVWAVRQQQGALSDLDAAVLFLDEWRKLYAN